MLGAAAGGGEIWIKVPANKNLESSSIAYVLLSNYKESENSSCAPDIICGLHKHQQQQ